MVFCYMEITFHVVFVVVGMAMVTFFESVLNPPWLLSGRAQSFATLSTWIRLAGLGAFFGMVGYLLCLGLVTIGLLWLLMLLVSGWRLRLALMLVKVRSLVVCFLWMR